MPILAAAADLGSCSWPFAPLVSSPTRLIGPLGFDTTASGIEASEFYWSTLRLAGGACVAAIVSLIFFREKLSDGARSSLMVIAVAGSYPWANWPLNSLQIHLTQRLSIQDDSAGDYLLFIGFFALGNLVPAVIGAAAISDAIGARFRIGVMAGIGSAMASVNLVVCLALYLPGYYTNAFPPWNSHLFYVLIAAPAALAFSGGSCCGSFGLVGRRLYATLSTKLRLFV